MTPREMFLDRIHGVHVRAAAVMARRGIRHEDVYYNYNSELQRMNIPAEEADWNLWDRISKGETK